MRRAVGQGIGSLVPVLPYPSCGMATMCSTQHVPMLTPWYGVFSAGAIRGPSTVWGNGLPRHQNPPRISKGAKLEREAQPVVPTAPHPDLLDVVVGQRVMAQQGGCVRGQLEQGRALARAPDASSRHVPSLRYPFIPAGAALSVRGLSSGRRSRSSRPPPNRGQERLI